VVDALFWPALLGYGEAALAYASVRTSRAATWGVRLGWVAQTALLAVQAARTDGFPWSTWAGSLNLFVWFVVGAYLIWGCRPRFRLLGLGVMPVAVALFLIAWASGGISTGSKPHYGNLFLVLHVGFVLAAFAGFTLAAALAALYLWEERRLKSRAADILRLRLPPLAAGIVRLRQDGDGLDALEVLTLGTWVVYGSFVAMRPAGRRAAYVALGGFVLVALARLALAGSHFT
jgi:ABC-type uncharacterized transport system permease subunit